MQPIGSVILKATAYCNLNCSYCYMFNLGDKSYLGRPKVMPKEVVRASAKAVAKYAKDQGIKSMPIVIHGGEPMLAGKDWLAFAVEEFRREGGDEVQFGFALQTNAVLISPSWIQLFHDLDVQVAVSMDGPAHVHDKYRVNHAGHGSHALVVKGLRMLMDSPYAEDVFGGVLCVIVPGADGLEIYRHFRELGVPRMDFLLPLEYNWHNTPPWFAKPGSTPIADYLIPIFDDWWAEGNPDVYVRIFFQILQIAMGAKRHIDSLGGDPINLAVIESDGSLEPLDGLRACEDGLTQLGLNILRDPLDALYSRRLFRIAMSGQRGLCKTCKECELRKVCGGGYLVNRYSRDNGFDNPSVLCADLYKLIDYVTDHAWAAVQDSRKAAISVV